jgi:hypothetical protein
MPPANPSSPQAAPTPVFVDDTGRRHRTVRLTGWILGAVMLAYLALLGISLVGSPGVVPLSLPAIGRLLPGPAAPLVDGPSSGASRPGDLVAGTVTAAGATSVDSGVSSGSAAQPGATQPGAAQPTSAQPTSAPHPAVSPAARPKPRPTTVPAGAGTPTPARTQQGNPSPNGNPRATHTPASHPTPKSTRRSAHSPKASPTPSPSAT